MSEGTHRAVGGIMPATDQWSPNQWLVDYGPLSDNIRVGIKKIISLIKPLFSFSFYLYMCLKTKCKSIGMSESEYQVYLYVDVDSDQSNQILVSVHNQPIADEMT